MGEVIAFKPRRVPAAVRDEDRHGGTAVILFYTGIRYERMAEAAPVRDAPGPKRPRGRRRA